MSRLKANLVSVYVLRAGAAGLELLTLQRAEQSRFPGAWQVVHGHVEPGEAAWQAASRELREETGLPALRWFRCLHLETFYNPENDTVYVVPVFVVETTPDARCQISAEHQACAWRSLDEARSLFLWATQRQSIDAVIEATHRWPQPGPGLQPIDLPALERAWADQHGELSPPEGWDA